MATAQQSTEGSAPMVSTHTTSCVDLAVSHVSFSTSLCVCVQKPLDDLRVYNLSEAGCEELFNHMKKTEEFNDALVKKYLPNFETYKQFVVLRIPKTNGGHDLHLVHSSVLDVMKTVKGRIDLAEAFGTFGHVYKWNWNKDGVKVETDDASQIYLLHMCKKLCMYYSFHRQMIKYLKKYHTDCAKNLDERIIQDQSFQILNSDFPKFNEKLLYGVNVDRLRCIFDFIKKPTTTQTEAKDLLLPKNYTVERNRTAMVECIDEDNGCYEMHSVDRAAYGMMSAINPRVMPSALFCSGECSNVLTSFNRVVKFVSDNPHQMILYEHIGALIRDSGILENVHLLPEQITSIPNEFLAIKLQERVAHGCSIEDMMHYAPIPFDKKERVLEIASVDRTSFIEGPLALIRFKADNEYHVMDNSMVSLLNFNSTLAVQFYLDQRKHTRLWKGDAIKCITGSESTINQYITDQKIDENKLFDPSPLDEFRLDYILLTDRTVDEHVSFIVNYGRMYGDVSKLLNHYKPHHKFYRIKCEVEKQFVRNNLVKIRYDMGATTKEEVVLAFEYFAVCEVNPSMSLCKVGENHGEMQPDSTQWWFAVHAVPLLKDEVLTLTPDPMIREFQKDVDFWGQAFEVRMDQLLKEYSAGHEEYIMELVKINLPDIPRKWNMWKDQIKRKMEDDDEEPSKKRRVESDCTTS